MKKLMATILMLNLSMATTTLALPITQDPVQPTQAQALTNKDVVEMIKAGLTADIVIAKIKSSPTSFDTSPTALAELKAASTPDTVILAMVKGPIEPVATASESGDTLINVPDGTEIEVQLTNNASGEELKVGTVVDFVVVRQVQIGNVIVFEKDASARARITTAKRAGHWGKAGKLEWAMQDVIATDGNRVPSRFVQRQIGDSKGGTVAVAAVATTVLLGPLGLLWGLKKGKPAIIPAGNRYSVFVSGDTKIKGKTSEAPKPTQ